MQLTGKNYLGNEPDSTPSQQKITAINPATGQALATDFYEATAAEIDRAVKKAEQAFQKYSQTSGETRAHFLEAIADEIMNLGDDLLNRCHEETALPLQRLTGERGRTVNQLKLFAELIREGSWVDARIDNGNPNREPLPKPDVRSMLRPLGPVGVFGASNFPLAFSVAGGDTASALAAGCPVVVKAHPAHPGTCELVARAINRAVEKQNMPEGVFSLVHGVSNAVGMALVTHPFIKAIGFTGSYSGGKALYDAAAKRAEPIPVYAEMGSTNPVFILPEALKKQSDTIAKNLAGSVTMGVGQFCTKPGLVFLLQSDDSVNFQQQFAEALQKIPAGTMLTEHIQKAFDQKLENVTSSTSVQQIAQGARGGAMQQGRAVLLQSTIAAFLSENSLEEELFGPAAIAFHAPKKEDLVKAAGKLSGHLTATLWATETDLKNHAALISILERKVGRLIINGFPTGVEVCHAMVHGGPFPATTDARSTSVGTLAIRRFARPVCYQDFPDAFLPDALKSGNPLNILRLEDGQFKR